jgi:ATP-dependent Clp protease adaptor protein ClpS
MIDGTNAFPHSRAFPCLPVASGGGDDGDDGGRRDGNVGIAVKTRTKTKKPSLYKVLMLNDDYTPMEFVVYVLQRFFNMDHGRAVEIMLTVHNKGVAVVGVYPFEVAETKVTQVMDCARSNQHPLQCTMEKE